MIQQIDLLENAGNSVPKINSNILELETIICNLKNDQRLWDSAMQVWEDNIASWTNMSTTVTELSGKWDDMANVVHSLSSFWNGTLTFIYPTPFVEGTQNVQPILNFLEDYHPPHLYNIDQNISVFFFIQNFDPNTAKSNIFQKSVSSTCFVNNGSAWAPTACNRNTFCERDNCDDLFEAIDVNRQYSCNQKTEILYYLINDV